MTPSQDIFLRWKDPGSGANWYDKALTVLDSLEKCEKLQPLSHDRVYSNSELEINLNKVSDCYKEIRYTLLNCHLKDYHLLWLAKLENLFTTIAHFKEYYFERLPLSENQPRNVLNFDMKIGKKIEDLSRQAEGLLKAFLGNPNLHLNKYVFSLRRPSNSINELLLSLFMSVLRCSRICEGSSNIFYRDSLKDILQPLSSQLVEYYRLACRFDREIREYYFAHSFSVLSKFLMMSYCTGNPESTKGLFILREEIEGAVRHPINPLFPLKLLRFSEVTYFDLVDYYRYAAYNFVSLSLKSDHISGLDYNLEADVYLKTVLNLPSLNPITYERDINEEVSDNKVKSREGPYLLSFLERQEVSLMYVLNYLLKLRSLKELVEQEHLLKAEIEFLVSSLSASISHMFNSARDLRGSYSDVDSSEGQRLTDAIKLWHSQTLSSPLFHGSYKEKLVLIIILFDHLKENDLDLASIIRNYSIQREEKNLISKVVGQMNASKFPGTSKYIECVGKIVRIFQEISVKHLAYSCGMQKLPLYYIKELFDNSENFISSLDEKSSIQQKGDFVEVSFESEFARESIETRVSKLIEIQELTIEMENMTLILN